MTDPAFWLALGAAILSALSIVLHAIAPRTKTTVDDRLVERIDEVLSLLRPAAPPPSPAVTIVNTGGPAALLALVVLGLGAAASSSACTPAQRTTAGHAVVDCTAGNAGAIGGTLASMKADKVSGGCWTAATETAPATTDWTCVRGKAISAGLQVGGCAFLELVSAATTARVSSATGEPPPERPGVAAFESYRASVAGGAAFRTAAGDR